MVALDHELYRGVTWATFRKKLARWRRSQRKMMREINHLIPDEDDTLAFEEDYDTADEEVLGLPSDFSRKERIEFDMDPELEDYELRIRVGMAFDQLEQIRRAVQLRAAHLEGKKKHARGHKDNAAAEENIKRQVDLAALLSRRYNNNYDCILALRPDDYDATRDDGPGGRLRRINVNEDLGLANLAAVRSLGDSQKKTSWIWEIFYSKQTLDTKHRGTVNSMTQCMSCPD